MVNDIELELRAEISLQQFEKMYANFAKKYKQLSHTKRLSVMFLFEINQSIFDVRVRISSNNRAEVVLKRGDLHAHNRIESSQKITKSQFIGLVKIFSLFRSESKVTERENVVFDLNNNITITLVRAGSIAYVEIEKMSNAENLEKNKLELYKIIDSIQLKIIKNSKEFKDLCDRLTKYSDWIFDGSDNHIKKLNLLLDSY